MADPVSVGSSALMVASALETAGYYYQSYVLDSFSSTIMGPLGAIAFIVAGILAITQYVVAGEYKAFLWFVVGPGLLAAVILTREPTTGSNWIFGDEARDQAEKNEVIQSITTIDNTNTPKVSSFFAWYNNLTSELVRSIVTKLVEQRQKADMTFVARTQLLQTAVTQSISDPRLSSMIHAGLWGHCGELAKAARQTHLASLGDRGADPKGEYQRFYSQNKDQEIVPYSQYTIDYLVSRADPANRANVAKEAQRSYSCQEIWDLVYEDLLDQSAQIQTRLTERAKSLGIPEEKFEADLTKALGGMTADDPNRGHELHQVLAKHLLKIESHKGSSARYPQMLARQGGEAGSVAKVERMKWSGREQEHKSRLVTTAMTLPYYQGLMLYFLAYTFPFFAILLVIPGKYTGALMWCVLWLWVKSWDIGYAVVMMLDDILFGMFAANQDPTASQFSNDLGTVMASLSAYDPTMNLSTYYYIVGVCFSTIPVIMGYMVMGAAKGGAQLIENGAKTYATSIGTGAGLSQNQGQNLQLRAGEFRAATNNIFNRLRNDNAKTRNDMSDMEYQSRKGGLPIMPNNRVDSISGRSIQQLKDDFVYWSAWEGAFEGYKGSGLVRKFAGDLGIAGNIETPGKDAQNVDVDNALTPITFATRRLAGTALPKVAFEKESAYKHMQARVGQVIAEEMFDYSLSFAGMAHAQDRRVYRGFELPSAYDDPGESIYAARMVKDQRLIESAKAISNTGFNLTRGGVQFIENYGKGKKMRGSVDKAGKKGGGFGGKTNGTPLIGGQLEPIFITLGVADQLEMGDFGYTPNQHMDIALDQQTFHDNAIGSGPGGRAPEMPGYAGVVEKVVGSNLQDWNQRSYGTMDLSEASIAERKHVTARLEQAIDDARLGNREADIARNLLADRYTSMADLKQSLDRLLEENQKLAKTEKSGN
ncbi:conjugal transfer protein TraG N-terminal domain-containing protein [bacterium]|nr:conjugal transfer protein TraG N-terminal domain-containing protein [bacterium]